jgi:YVTN family beta-propeller protein
MRLGRAPRLAALGAAVTVLWTCGDSTAPVLAARLDVVPPIVRVGVGQSVQLVVTATDAAGSTVTGVALGYESDDPDVAGVSASGRVTGAATGITTLTVTGGGASARVPIRVGGVPATIQVTPAEPEIVQGGGVGLIVVVRDSAGVAIPDPSVTFVTSDPTIATVTTAGVVTGVAAGPATITATAVPAVATVSVSVLGHPAGTVVTGTPLGQRPYGVAVSRVGVVYVTRLDAAAVSRADLPATSFPTAVSVGAAPTDVAFDPTGTRAYVTNQASRNVGIVDVATNTQIDVIPVNGDAFRVLVSPSGARLYVTTNADNLLVIDLPAKTVHAEYMLGSASSGITLNASGSLLYGTTIGGLVYEINTATDSARALLTTGYLQGIAVSHDGAELYVAKQDGEMEVRNAATGVLVTTVPAAAGVFDLKLTRDGRQLYAGILFGGVVRVIDRATRTVVQTIPVGNDPRRIAFDRYGLTAVVTDQSGAVFFIR